MTPTPTPLPALELRRQLANAVEAALGWTKIRPGMLYERYGLRPGSTREELLPDYLDSVGAAWECVTWLEERGWHLCGLEKHPLSELGWRCMFSEVGGWQRLGSDDTTAPLAICRAFLAVLSAHPELRGKGNE